MTWKCPHCNKKLEENDATRGNCPYCFQVFDRPEEFQEEEVPAEEVPAEEVPAEEVPAEEPAQKSGVAKRDNDSTLLWLSLTALCLLLVSLFLEIRQPLKKYQSDSAQIKTEKTAPNQEQPSQSKEANDVTNSIRAKEQEIAQTVLWEYGEKTCQRINETLKQERLLQQKDETKLGSMFGNPVGLAHTQLQSVYAQYGQAYLLLLSANKNAGGLKIITDDIVASDNGFAKGKLVVQPIAPSSLNAENINLFNTVHSEPYQFLVSCTRSGKEWKVKEWTMVGTEWNFRPLPR